MALWIKVLLLGIGLTFLAVGAIVGVFGTRQAKAELAMLERLTPLSATAFEDQPVGTAVLIEGIISPRNPAVFRNFVAYVRQELDVTTDSDGDRREDWRSDGRETPRLTIDATGPVIVGNETYGIQRAHEVWDDEAKLGFNDRPRDGSERYHALVAGRPVTAYGTVVAGQESNELAARTIFGGTHEEYLTSGREGVAFMPIFGGIFGVIGLVLCGISVWFFLRR